MPNENNPAKPNPSQSKLQLVFDWIKKYYAIMITLLFLTSELLASFPGVRANSVFQLVFSFLKTQQQETGIKLPPIPEFDPRA